MQRLTYQLSQMMAARAAAGKAGSKVVKPEPSKEVRLEENSGWRQRRGGTVVDMAAWLEGCAAQRAANAAT